MHHIDGQLLVLLSLSRRSGFMPEQIQDVLTAVACMACGGLHILLRLPSSHLCNEYPSLPKKEEKGCTTLMLLAQFFPRAMPDCPLLPLGRHCSQGSSLPSSKGGVGLVHVPTRVQASQAKVVSRLLEPERLAWKVFQLYHPSQASQVHAVKGCAAFSDQHSVQHAQYSCQLQWPARLSVYVAAFRALHPHLLGTCLLDVVIAPCPVIANHGLQCELSRQVAKSSEVDDHDSEARCDEGDDARNASGSGFVLAGWPGQSDAAQVQHC